MFDWAIFAVGLFVTLLLAAGLVLTVLEFRDIARHPEQHEPDSFRKMASTGPSTNRSGVGLESGTNIQPSEV